MTRLILLGPLIAAGALALAGCNTPGGLTPAESATLFCVVSADGVVVAQAVTKGGAQATAQKLGAAQPVACSTATAVGQALTK